eukprot:scaffold2352_cov103-Isochrysis_galbana.AAC.3
MRRPGPSSHPTAPPAHRARSAYEWPAASAWSFRSSCRSWPPPRPASPRAPSPCAHKTRGRLRPSSRARARAHAPSPTGPWLLPPPRPPLIGARESRPSVRTRRPTGRAAAAGRAASARPRPPPRRARLPIRTRGATGTAAPPPRQPSAQLQPTARPVATAPARCLPCRSAVGAATGRRLHPCVVCPYRSRRPSSEASRSGARFASRAPPRACARRRAHRAQWAVRRGCYVRPPRGWALPPQARK